MKFNCHIEIEGNLESVAATWSNEAYFHHWQDGFQVKQVLSGRSGEVDCRSEIIYSQGKSSMKLVETVLSNKLPHSFSASYEHRHMDNLLTTEFRAIDDNLTKLTYEVEYTAFRGVVPRLMAFFVPGVFKRQVQKWLVQFKKFVEEEMVE